MRWVGPQRCIESANLVQHRILEQLDRVLVHVKQVICSLRTALDRLVQRVLFVKVPLLEVV